MEAKEQYPINSKPLLFRLREIAGSLFAKQQPVPNQIPESSTAPSSTSTIVSATPVTPSIPGNRTVREARKQAYAQAHRGQTAKSEKHEPAVITIPPITQSQPKTEAKPKNLPPGFQEIKRSNETLHVTRADLPWMSDDDKDKIPLVEITVTGNEKFYFGNAVRGNLAEITANAFERNASGNQDANDLLYSRLPGFIRGDRTDIRTIQHPKTDNRQIYYVAGDGIRVYFMRFENRNSCPVLIRIAACANKTQEKKIITIISTSQRL